MFGFSTLQKACRQNAFLRSKLRHPTIPGRDLSLMIAERKQELNPPAERRWRDWGLEQFAALEYSINISRQLFLDAEITSKVEPGLIKEKAAQAILAELK